MRLPFLNEIVAESTCRAMGLKQNCGTDDLDTRVRMEKNEVVEGYKSSARVDPNDHTRWKHMSRWHNRGCVWDHIASEWSGEEEWSVKRKRCQGVEDNMDSVTFCA